MEIKRVLIKLSGEAISDSSKKFDISKVEQVCAKLKSLHDNNIGISIVIGGGNIIRGRDFQNANISRETADSVGMISTFMNGLILRDALNRFGIHSEIVSNLNLPFGVLNSNPWTIENLIHSSKTIIFVGGLGTPYFSTDTVSVIAALMSKSDVLLKATKTDGVYTDDPAHNLDALHIPELTYSDAISQNLKIMDTSAFVLAEQNKLRTHIFSIFEDDCFIKSINNTIKQSVLTKK